MSIHKIGDAPHMSQPELVLDPAVVVLDEPAKSKRFNDTTIGRYRWLNHDVYKGTSGGLIRAGLIVESMLPGRPGNKKTVSEFKVAKGSVGVTRIYKCSASRYNVLVTISDLERQNRERERDINYNRAMQAKVLPRQSMPVARGAMPLVVGKEPIDLTTNEVLLLNAFRAMDNLGARAVMVFARGEASRHPASRVVPALRLVISKQDSP